MKKYFKKILFSFILILIIIGLFFSRTKIKNIWLDYQKEPVPIAQNFNQINNANIAINENININSNNQNNNINTEIIIDDSDIKIKDSVNLNIPFQSQAPNGNWDQPYQEACEEASLILSINYLRGSSSLSKEQMNEKILALVDWQNKNWGGHHDLTAKKTVELMNGFYDDEFKTEIIKDFTWDDVKKALSQGYPVIAPTAGRLLNNPFYTAPGPIYHMLVIKGYTAKVIITNDVGTRRGADYQYSYDTLYNGIHDWNDGDVNNGQKIIIIIKPNK